MASNKSLFIKIIPAVLAIVSVFYCLLYLNPFLYIHAQQAAFITNISFLKEHLFYPSGISEYISKFILQGFNGRFLGIAIQVGLQLFQFYLLQRLLKSLFSIHDWIIPFFLVLFSVALGNNYLIPFLIFVNQMVLIVSLLLFSKWGNSKLHWVLFIFLYCTLYYVSGSGVAVTFVISAIAIVLLKGKNGKLFSVALFVAFASILPYVAFKFVFNISLDEAYFYVFPKLTINVRYIPSSYFYVYIFFVPASLIFMSLLHALKLSKSRLAEQSYWMFHSVVFVVLLGVSFFVVRSSQQNEKRDGYLCDYYNSIGAFEQTIEIANRSKEKYNILINVHYNRAIINLNELPEKILEYPQLLGSQILSPDRLGTPEFVLAASDYYLDLGYVSQSQHAAYALLAINKYNKRALERLVETNILLGNYRGAKPYINTLKQMFFTSEFVDKYEGLIDNPELIDQYPKLQRTMTFIPDNMAIPVRTSDRMMDLVVFNERNLNAINCLLISNLFDHEVGAFMSNLKYFTNISEDLPTLYQEVVLMHAYNTNSNSLGGFRVAKKTSDVFIDFLKQMKKVNQETKEEQKLKMSEFKETYMYYTMFLSPKVTKVKVSQTY